MWTPVRQGDSVQSSPVCLFFVLFITVLYHLLSFLPLFFPLCLQFKVDGEWWTWIDYERFQELILEYEESEGTKSFSAMDYMAKTPSWAIFGARERGFEPSDTRFQRKNKTKDISGCWCYFCLPTLSIGEFVFWMNGIDDLIDCTHRLRLFFVLFLPRLSLLSKTCLRDEILISKYLQILDKKKLNLF